MPPPLEYGTYLQYDEKQVIRGGTYKNTAPEPSKCHTSLLADVTTFSGIWMRET